MADKSVGELIAAQSVMPTDLFVLEQNGVAKKLTGQILENWLVSFADGHGGIQNIEKVKTSGLVDTYRITLADTTTFDFVVTNGRGVRSIEKTATEGLVDTYTITYNDNTTNTFTVTNGEKGDKGDNAYLWIKFASQQPTASSNSFGDVPDDWIGIYFGGQEEAPTDWQQYIWYKIKGEKGDTGDPATLVSASVTYQVGETGTIIPSGAWTESIPVAAQGKYLWTKIVQQFNTGSPITAYTVSRMGLDGLGSVVSVAGVSPDESGNVPLTADDIRALPILGGGMEGPINMNGQTLSGLNAPVNGSDAVPKDYVLELNRMAAPRNILDNSDFTNPVNTGGLTSLVANGSAYQPFLDRWLHVDFSGASVTFTLTDNGVAVTNGTGYFYQRYKKGSLKASADYRLAVYYADGTFDIRKKVYPAFVVSVANEQYDQLYFTVDAGKTVSKVAVYEGVYTLDTLPEYQPKGYENELLICRQYDLDTGEYIGLRKFGQPRNLLDNSDFRNPVNQRGQASYTEQGFSIDWWYKPSNTTTLDTGTNGVTFTATTETSDFRQTFDDLTSKNMGGKVFTFAVCEMDGTITVASGLCSSENVTQNTSQFAKPSEADDYYINMYKMASNQQIQVRINMRAGKSNTFKWAALYEGEYSIDTLPDYVPKERIVEEMNCGIVPGKIDLLWQNGSPTSTFGADTVDVDLSLYNWAVVEVGYSIEYPNIRTTKLVPILEGNSYGVYMNRSSNTIARRNFTLSKTGVAFENGASGSSNSSEHIIPTRIYGVKG